MKTTSPRIPGKNSSTNGRKNQGPALMAAPMAAPAPAKAPQYEASNRLEEAVAAAISLMDLYETVDWFRVDNGQLTAEYRNIVNGGLNELALGAGRELQLSFELAWEVVKANGGNLQPLRELELAIWQYIGLFELMLANEAQAVRDGDMVPDLANERAHGLFHLVCKVTDRLRSAEGKARVEIYHQAAPVAAAA